MIYVIIINFMWVASFHTISILKRAKNHNMGLAKVKKNWRVSMSTWCWRLMQLGTIWHTFLAASSNAFFTAFLSHLFTLTDLFLSSTGYNTSFLLYYILHVRVNKYTIVPYAKVSLGQVIISELTKSTKILSYLTMTTAFNNYKTLTIANFT